MGKETEKRDKGRVTERREREAMKDGETERQRQRETETERDRDRERQRETERDREQKEATTEKIRKNVKTYSKQLFFKWTALINHYRSVTSTFVSTH